ncbi:MAG TPA: lipopolysaccharide transport periplasmic protein LptA [Thermodesulfobacteriota bacterium]|nr:lipopolysaccharide transport periplasmic protein LptA [Thermodesulfobacteriota bacterium]
MRLRVLGVLVLIFLAGDGTVNLTCCDAALRVGVLPFRIYSSEKVNYLQDEVPKRLSEQLAKNKDLVLVDPLTVQSSLSGQVAGREWSKGALDQIARTTEADFLVYGSLTKIENALSIDASVFTTLPDTGTFRSFVEGRDLDLLIKQMEGKIAQHLLTAGAAKLTPPTETVVAKASPPESTQRAAAEEQAPGVEGAAQPAPPTTPEQPNEPEAEIEEPPTPAEEQVPEEQAAVTEAAEESAPPEPAQDSAEPESIKAMNAAGASAPSESGDMDSAKKAPANRLPIRISSDRMVADNPQQTVTFFGSVKAVKDDMVIHSDQMTTFYSKGQEVEKIIAQGNVKISQKDLAASCRMATFLQGAQKIILTGKPKVWQGNNMVSGEKIEILLDQDKILIEGGKKKEERVNVVIYPKEKKE